MQSQEDQQKNINSKGDLSEYRHKDLISQDDKRKVLRLGCSSDKVSSLSRNTVAVTQQYWNKAENEELYVEKRNQGLPNIGNTCFLNSVLQLLYAATKFHAELSFYFSNPQILKIESQKQSIIYHLYDIFEKIKHHANRIQKQKVLFATLGTMTKLDSTYQFRRQYDAFETFNFLVFNSLAEYPNLAQLFRVEYLTSCKCKSSRQRLNEISLPSQNPICMSCQSRKDISLISEPEYLALQIVGSSYENPREEVLYKSVKRQLCAVYKLISATIYSGNGEYGHYTSIRKNSEKKGKWISINDSWVEEVPEFKPRQGYKKLNILLYEKQAQRKAYQEMRKPINRGEAQSMEQKVNFQRIKGTQQIAVNTRYRADIQFITKMMRVQAQKGKQEQWSPLKQSVPIYFLLDSICGKWKFKLVLLNCKKYFDFDGQIALKDIQTKQIPPIDSVIESIEQRLQKESMNQFKDLKGEYYKKNDVLLKNMKSYTPDYEYSIVQRRLQEKESVGKYN